jgi:hypothetical protein
MENIRGVGSSCDDEYWDLRVEPCSGLRVSHYSQNLLVGICFTSQYIFQKEIPLLITRAAIRAIIWATIASLPFGFMLMVCAAQLMTRIDFLGMATMNQTVHN